jgi:hypothetical protein
MPDMAKYLRLQLGTHPAVVESHKPLVRFQDDFSIGYFWNIGNNRQLGTHYVHHGGVPRAQSYAYVVPQYQLGVSSSPTRAATRLPAPWKARWRPSSTPWHPRTRAVGRPWLWGASCRCVDAIP